MSSSPTTTGRKPRPADPPLSGSAADDALLRSGKLAVKFWGVRGSIPAPGPGTHRYGGNTPCLEIRFGQELCIFDLGSGARALGESLNGDAFAANIFVTHYHYDHLQGLPFFTPMMNPKNRFTIYGPSRNGQSVKDILSGQMSQPYFPVAAAEVFRAQAEYRSFAEGQRLELGGAIITALELNHPGGNLGYRIDYQGRSVVYATDLEHGSALDSRFYEFARGTDVLIYDAMYTEDEYAGTVGPSRKGWGHSTWQAAVAAAEQAKVGKLVLFHHDPTRSDVELEGLLQRVRVHRPEAIAAHESLVLEV